MAYVNTTSAARKGFADRLAYLKDSVLTAIHQRRVYAQTVAELNALTDRELGDRHVSLALAARERRAPDQAEDRHENERPHFVSPWSAPPTVSFRT